MNCPVQYSQFMWEQIKLRHRLNFEKFHAFGNRTMTCVDGEHEPCVGWMGKFRCQCECHSG